MRASYHPSFSANRGIGRLEKEEGRKDVLRAERQHIHKLSCLLIRPTGAYQQAEGTGD